MICRCLTDWLLPSLSTKPVLGRRSLCLDPAHTTRQATTKDGRNNIFDHNNRYNYTLVVVLLEVIILCNGRRPIDHREIVLSHARIHSRANSDGRRLTRRIDKSRMDLNCTSSYIVFYTRKFRFCPPRGLAKFCLK